MTGRGTRDMSRERVIRAGEHPKVDVPVTLSTTPSKLDHSSEEPFNVVVTAHNPLDYPITFYAFFNCFFSLSEGSYANIRCTTSDKLIKNYPQHRLHMRHNAFDLDRRRMITVPANGSVSKKLELHRSYIEAAAVQPGERYRVSFTHPRMGALFWCYGSMDGDLQPFRFQLEWTKGLECKTKTDPVWLDAAIEQQYRDAPFMTGDSREDFCLVTESSVEFEII